MDYHQLKELVKKQHKNDKLTKKNLVILETRIFNDLEEKDAKCRKCGRTENLTLDHIIPRSILATFGVDIEREIIDGNYQILCKTCNTFKAGRLDFSTPETKMVLIKLLEKM